MPRRRKQNEENESLEMDGFEGFDKPEENWSKLPHSLIEALPQISTIAEMKVIIYVLRHTWGYQEFDEGKKITVDEFMHGRKRRDGSRIDNGTGLTKPSIIDGCRRAVADGFMVVEIDARDLGRVEKYYMLHMKEKQGSKVFTPSDQGSKVFTPEGELGVKSLDPGVKRSSRRGKRSLQRSEKETKKETIEERKEDIPLSSSEKSDPERERLAGIWREVLAEIETRFGWNRALPLRQFQLVGEGDRVLLIYPDELNEMYFRNGLRQLITNRLEELLGQAVDLRAV